MSQVDKSLHICLLGDAGIGQSSLLRSFRGDSEDDPQRELESYITTVDLDGEPYRIRFTDSVGKACFDRMRKPILNTAHTVLLCFSMGKPETLKSVEDNWIPLLRAMGTKCPLIVAGLQSDLHDPNGFTAEDGEAVSARHDAVGYLECSALEPESVTLLIQKALLTAKEYYGYRWQQKKITQTDRAASDQHIEDLRRVSCSEENYLAETVTLDEDINPLKKEDVTTKLSVLGITPARTHAYLRVDLADMGLTTVDAIRSFHHLQFVNVSGNRMRSLEPLSALPFLLHLNASQNLLTRTQSFAAPRQLETVDMSYNMIGDLGDWGVHKFLRELNLRGNFIQQITAGLSRNKTLKMLDISENHITHVENMDDLNLEALYLAQNQLTTLDGINTLSKLQVLNVKHNEIRSLAALSAQDIPRIRKLCISENHICHISEIEKLQSFPFLCDLFLAPNPITDLPYYRAQILHRLPRLRWLDELAVSAEEKAKADVMYGADVEKRKDIFTKLLPEETFVDRRLVTEEDIIKMEEEKFGQQGGFGADEEGEIPQEGDEIPQDMDEG